MDQGARDSTDGSLPDWLAVVLVSGTSAAVLVLEILAGRLLAPYVGVSLDTFTGIIGTILAGIALGASAGGRLADRVAPRRLLPVMLVLGGALAIATIPIVRALGESGRNSGGSSVLVLTVLGFLPAAAVLSAVPPTVVKAQLQHLEQTGSTVGRLSAWGTAGAIFGTFFTGYVLVASAAVTALIVWTGVVLIVSGALLAVVFRRFLPIGSTGRDLLAGAALVGLSLGGVAATESPCEVRSAYYCIDIRVDDDRPSGRVLVLDDLRHSYVDLDDPTHLEFWYIRQLADAIDRASESAGRPIDVLHIGGGGFTIPRREQAVRPTTRQIVIEIDGGLVDMVRDRLAFEESDTTDVRVGDARLELTALADDSADVVIGDAFGSRAVPFHLATREFIRDVDRVLRPGGIVGFNIIDRPSESFLRAETATVAESFTQVAVIRGPVVVEGIQGNSIILASDTELPIAAISAAVAGGDVIAGAELIAYIGDADVLTDDFAPVDQLLGF